MGEMGVSLWTQYTAVLMLSTTTLLCFLFYITDVNTETKQNDCIYPAMQVGKTVVT